MKPGRFTIEMANGSIGETSTDYLQGSTIRVVYGQYQMWLTIDELKAVKELISLYLKGLDK